MEWPEEGAQILWVDVDTDFERSPQVYTVLDLEASQQGEDQ